MKRIVLSFLVTLMCLAGFSQGEDFATATSFTATCIANYSATTCTGTTYNLGSSTTAVPAPQVGTMGNDVWFRFTAPCELIKIKVCSPSFDAAVEIWSSTQAFLGSVNLSSSTGLAGKEYFCQGGLTTNSEYYVRVGRFSGTGAGTFTMNIEHNKVEVSAAYTPAPPGYTCYRPGLNIKRTNTCATPVTSTRWKFVDSNNNEIICIGAGDQPIASCGDFCLDGSTWTVYCEVRANDAECGNIFWGYGPGKPMTMCSTTCVNITSPANNSTTTSILSQQFTPQYPGPGYDYQWRVLTDGGNTIFCTPWTATANFIPSDYSIGNCLTFNKIYQVQVRIRYCDSEPDPEWCPPITIITAPLPYITVSSGNCCRWRNLNGGTIAANGVSGVNQYRWRFTPLATGTGCPQPPYLPIGNACTTSWSTNSTVNPNTIGCLSTGTIYMVQVQGRKNAVNCSSCTGTNVPVPSQQSDWGPACFIGIRAANSPAVGTPLACNCTPNMPELDIPEDPIEFEVDYSVERDMGVMTANVTGEQIVAIDLQETNLEGDGFVRMYNLSGQLILEQNVYDVRTNSYFILDIEQKLSSGIYIISIVTDNGTVSDKIFIGKD